MSTRSADIMFHAPSQWVLTVGSVDEISALLPEGVQKLMTLLLVETTFHDFSPGVAKTHPTIAEGRDSHRAPGGQDTVTTEGGLSFWDLEEGCHVVLLCCPSDVPADVLMSRTNNNKRPHFIHDIQPCLVGMSTQLYSQHRVENNQASTANACQMFGFVVVGR